MRGRPSRPARSKARGPANPSWAAPSLCGGRARGRDRAGTGTAARVLTNQLIVAEQRLAEVRDAASRGLVSGLGTNALAKDVALYEKQVALIKQQLKAQEDIIDARKNAAALTEADLASTVSTSKGWSARQAANTALKKQVEEVLALHKQVPGEVEKAVAKAKFLGVSFPPPKWS